MHTLMEPCCTKCTHTLENPCKEYVPCRTQGPLCHEDEKCVAKRKELVSQTILEDGAQYKQILICTGTGCLSSGAGKIADNLKAAFEKEGISNIKITPTGCHGFCEQGPIVVIEPEDVFYCQVTPDDVPEIVESHFKKGELVKRLLFHEPATDQLVETYHHVHFYEKQERYVLRNCGQINPELIEEYIAHEGYMAIHKVLSNMEPKDVIEEVKKSSLRGRGGAGFPTGMKWEFTHNAPGDKKYIVCNADEGDPGAFMDRSVLEGDPHAVLEGMLIAGFAIGSDEGYIYCRAEYPLAIKRLQIAIDQAREFGLLGKNILGSGFNFDVKIKAGAGAFVCGEETALLTSIEGNRGMPRVRPPFPAVKGLWGKPTNINNVESFANIPNIIRNGAEWYAAIGTEKSKGTKVFALTGKVNNTGLAEVPMGIPMREIIFDIGGGIKDGKKFKAVQIGGPSGGCLPESMLDLPVDYESLLSAGAMMGSGGLVIMDETTCMVDLARFFLSFTQAESCGKCTPCRDGTKRMLEILVRITEGEGTMADIEKLESMAKVIKSTSLCGLGQSAPNPVLSTLRYFKDEFIAHIQDKRCPAGACANLLSYFIIEDKCKGCNLCAKNCPVSCISGKPKETYFIHQENCIKCGVCMQKCPFDAIIKQ